MQSKYRLYHRVNGAYYAHDRETGTRQSLKTKSRAEAENLVRAKDEAHIQPAFNRELAKVYLRAQDPELCERTWQTVAAIIDATYEGSTRKRFAKFMRSEPMAALKKIRLIDTTAGDILAALMHSRAGVSTNVQMRILHNRALGLGWLLHPALTRDFWPKLKYRKRRGITPDEHERILAVTSRVDFRLFLELLQETGGSQTDIASLTAEDVVWEDRRLFYERAKLQNSDQGRACITIGERLEKILRQLPSSGPLFPKLGRMSEGTRSAIFWKRRRAGGVEDGIVLHSYRYAWAERAQKAGMPAPAKVAFVADGLQAIDTTGCPADFRVAFQQHVVAWRQAQTAVANNTLGANFAEGLASFLTRNPNVAGVVQHDAAVADHEVLSTYRTLTSIAAAHGARIPRSVVE